ncbi:MAG: TIGR01777 family oxidoreductase [Gammaproteobacteria bacterium]
MKIFITGGTGFVGQALVKSLLAQQHQVTIVGRDTKHIERIFGATVSALDWQALAKYDLDDLMSVDAIINLAGANIGERRWTGASKQELLNSRLQTTHQLVMLCQQLEDKAPRLISASAVGIYGGYSEEPNDKSPLFTEYALLNMSNFPDFPAELCRRWEQEMAYILEQTKAVVYLRFGVVLDPSGGALAKLLLPFKLGLGGVIGHGRQYFPWISLVDVVRAIEFILQQPAIYGAVNIVAPEIVTQAKFARTLAQTLHRPCLFKTPAWVLRLAFGEMADALLLKGQRVQPQVLQKYKFDFKYPQLSKALQALVS